MADQNELPEGTDKIIGGASNTGATGGGAAGLGAGGVGEEPTDVLIIAETDEGATTTRTSSGTGSGSTSGSSGSFLDKLRSGGGNVSGQAADKARGLVGQGLERGSEALGNVSRMIGDTATGIDERLGEEYGDYARRAASAIENAANSLASKDPDELIDDTREFVRRSPGVALAGAAVVGFAIARLIKTGLSGTDSSGGRGSSRDTTES